jgi:hypothetical protein
MLNLKKRASRFLAYNSLGIFLRFEGQRQNDYKNRNLSGVRVRMTTRDDCSGGRR